MDKILSLSTSQLRLSQDKRKLLLLISLVREDVSAADIINLIKKSDYANYRLKKNGLNKAVHCFKDIKNEVIGNTKFQSIVIAERRDAELDITFDPLKISAKAKIISAFEGNAITYQQVMDAIHELHITIGISQQAIKQLIKKSIQAKPGTAYQITIAKGPEAVNGIDSYFECLLEAPKDILINSINLQYGSFDMSKIGKLISVKEGDQLMRRYPSCKGHDGMTVTGEIIKHTPANDYIFEVGKNTAISDSDENILLATTAGTPIQLDRGMEVDELLMLDSLNADSAHINHKGSLIIAGDICNCKEIIATGDITVIGFIESSKVQCGGDLFVTKGILGHPVKNGCDDFSSNISCEGSLFANFIQYSTINIGEDLNLKYQLLHCHVYSKGYINVKDEEGNKGTIFGGFLSADKGICTVTLGAPAGIKTTIDLIGAYSELLDNKKRIKSAINLVQEKLRAVLSAQRKLTNIGNSEKTQLLDERLTLTVKETKKQLLKLNNAREDNYFERQQYLNNTNVQVLKALHSDVSISIGDNIFRAGHSYAASKICVKNAILVVEPYQ